MSVQFSCSVVSDCLQLHELQHARPPCPLPTPRVYSNSCPLSQWCHPTIWVSSLHQVAKVLEFQLQYQSFQWIVREYWFPEFKGNIQREYWFPLGLTGWISWLSKGLSRVFSNTTVLKRQFFGAQLSLRLTLGSVQDYWRNHSLYYTDLCGQSVVSAF